ncbi:hypothetical protein Tco_0073036, partial [Tanacetum coccineum]
TNGYVYSTLINLLFDDADGIDSLPNQAIFDAIQLMGMRVVLLQKDHLKHYLHPLLLPLVKYPMSHRLTHHLLIPFEQQTDQSPRPSFITTIPDFIPETSGENLGGHSSSDKSLSGNEGDMTLQTKPVIKHHRAWLKSVSLQQRFPRKSFSKKHRVHKESVSKQGRKFAKECHDEEARENEDEDKEIDENNTYTKIKLDSKISTEEHIEGTEEHNEGTEENNKGTKEKIESTEGQRKGTEDHSEEGNATQATLTPTFLTILVRSETIAKVLLNMSQAKAVSREKEKGTKERRKLKRSRSERKFDGIPKAGKKFKQLETDEETARKIQEEWEGEEERNRIAEEKAANEALIRNFDDIKARIEADRLLAEKLQEQEREQFTIEEEQSSFMTQLLLKNKIPFANRDRANSE